MEQRMGSRYRLVRRLGTGMMGHLYVGVRDEGNAAPPGEDIQPDVAVKVVREDLVTDAGVVSHLRDQVRRAVAVRGDHLVAVQEVVIDDDGRVGLVTDLSAGESLRRRIDATGPMLPSEVARIGGEIATALDTLHTNGLTHLAVKPENMLLDETTVKLTGHCLVPVLMDAPGLGRNAVVLGMPHYVAPEIPRGDRVGPAADLYSLGIVLYELSCGVTPFAAPAVADVIRGHTELLPGRPDGIPDDLWAVIAALLTKDPADRPTAGQIANLLGGLSWRLSQWPVASRLNTSPSPVAPAPAVQPFAAHTAPSGAGMTRSRRRTVAIAAAVVLAAAAGVWLYAAPGSPTSSGTAGQAGSVDTTTSPPVAPPASTPHRASAVMPDLVGRTLADARAVLPQDTEVETMPTEATNREDGTIVAQQPAAGTPIPRTVRLTVARTVVPIYLDSLDPVAGEWDSNEAANGVVGMVGRQYLHSVADDVSGCSSYRPTGEVEYNLSKGYRKLVASAGLGDDAENAELTIQLEVFADGRSVVNTAIEYGRVVPLEIDLTDVLRLRIQWQRTNQDDTCDGATFALGAATLFGFPGQIPTSGVPVPTATVPGGPTR